MSALKIDVAVPEPTKPAPLGPRASHSFMTWFMTRRKSSRILP
jgi:hypothetical protein